MTTENVPGYEGTVGPFKGRQYFEPHVYARDVHSGAGNCVCGADLGSRRHTQAAPGVPVPTSRRSPDMGGPTGTDRTLTDGTDIPAVIDAHQWALLVGIDLEGGAHVMSSRVVQAEAARLLRLLADRFEATHTPAGQPR